MSHHRQFELTAADDRNTVTTVDAADGYCEEYPAAANAAPGLVRREDATLLASLINGEHDEPTVYDTSAIDDQYSLKQRVSGAASTGSTFSFAAGIAVATVAGLLSPIR